MSLTSLPNEILIQIIDCACPEDFESCSLVCKTIWRLAASRAEEYNTLKRQYENVSIAVRDYDFAHPRNHHLEVPETYSELAHPIELLYDLWKRPIVARYVERLLFNQHCDENPGDEISKKIEMCNGCLPFLEESNYAERATCLDNQRINATRIKHDISNWHNDILAGDPGSTFVLLLTLLPNLKSVELINTSDYHRQYLNGTTEVIAMDAAANRPHPLSSLAVTRIENLGDHFVTPLQTFASFAALPSVRKLIGYRVQADYSYSDYNWPFGDHVSRVEEIEVSDGSVSAKHIESFVAPLPSLRIFRWHHRPSDDGAAFHWNGGAFLRAIGRRAGPKLERLSLSIASRFESLTALGSFKDFPKLEFLEVDVKLLFGEQEQGLEDEAILQARGWGPGYHDEVAETPLPKIVDIVPPSLKMLRLIIGKYRRSAWTLFRGFSREEKERYLPELSQVILSYDGPSIPVKTVRKLDSAGVDVKLQHDIDEDAVRFWEQDDYSDAEND